MRTSSISVIIPHLNQSDELNRCLSALAQQVGVFKLSEIIVIDNGSVEMPGMLCAGDPKIVLLSELEPGPGPARNAGVSHAKGDILAFIDADCIPEPVWLSSITRYFNDNLNVEIIGGPVHIEKPFQRPMTSVEAYERVYAFRIEDYIKRHKFAGTGNMAVRRDVMYAVGPFAGIQLSEDMDWGQRAHRLGFQTKFCSEMSVSHPSRGSFEALKRKWDRQIAHKQVSLQSQTFPVLKTVAIAAMLFVSPLFEIPRIASSFNIKGIRLRVLAFVCLTRIRIYRAGRMLLAVLNRCPEKSLSQWNRN